MRPATDHPRTRRRWPRPPAPSRHSPARQRRRRRWAPAGARVPLVAGVLAALVATVPAAATAVGEVGAPGAPSGAGRDTAQRPSTAAAPAPAHPATQRVATAPGATTSPARWGWPLAGRPPVTRRFDPPAQRYGRGHRGVDLAGTGGAVVVAAGTGVIGHAGPVAGRGVVTVVHEGGIRTTYEPVRPLVREGQRVGRGERIGALVAGHRGCPVTACLHWGALRGQSYLDPLSLLSWGPVRLLPISGGSTASHRPAAVARSAPDPAVSGPDAAATAIGAAAVSRRAGWWPAVPATVRPAAVGPRELTLRLDPTALARLRQAGLLCAAGGAALVLLLLGRRGPP